MLKILLERAAPSSFLRACTCTWACWPSDDECPVLRPHFLPWPAPRPHYTPIHYILFWFCRSFPFFIEEKFYTNGDIYWTEVGVQERTLSYFIIRSSAWVNCHKKLRMSYQSAVQQGVIQKVNYHLNEGNIVTSVPSLRLKSTSCVNHFTDK